MPVSVIDPIGKAFGRTRAMLFDRGSVKKWFVMGFCAFLAALVQGGGGGGNGFNWAQRAGRGGASPARMLDWLQVHLTPVLLIGGGVLLLLIALSLLLTWLGSRGQFMFLDNVVKDRAAVAEPWRRFEVEGNSLWLWIFSIGAGVLLLFLILIGFAFWMVIPAIRAERFTMWAVVGVLVVVPPILLVALAWGLFRFYLINFVIPIMYQRGLGTRAAMALFWRELLRPNLWPFVLYFLMCFVLGLASGLLMLFGICLTCCIAALPYLSSVAFLPIFVFYRCYSLYFLAEFGNEWRLLPDPAPRPAAGSPPASASSDVAHPEAQEAPRESADALPDRPAPT